MQNILILTRSMRKKSSVHINMVRIELASENHSSKLFKDSKNYLPGYFVPFGIMLQCNWKITTFIKFSERCVLSLPFCVCTCLFWSLYLQYVFGIYWVCVLSQCNEKSSICGNRLTQIHSITKSNLDPTHVLIETRRKDLEGYLVTQYPKYI